MAGEKNRSDWMQELSWPEVESRIRDSPLVLVPIGSTEQHGRHLPLGVDVFIPVYAAEQVALKTGVLIAPPIWYGPAQWHMSFPGTITIQTSTLIALLRDVCRSLAFHGVKHVVLINGHTGGSNHVVMTFADDMQTENPDLRIWIVDVVVMAKSAVLDVSEAPLLGHADEVETSQMLVVRPDLVHMEQAGESIDPPLASRYLAFGYRPTAEEIFYRWTPADWRKATSTGYIGSPKMASEQKGRAMLEALVDNLASFVSDIQGQDGPVASTERQPS